MASPNKTLSPNNVFCDALCYYLDHLKLDLKHKRMEFLRDNADRICAMLNGYATIKGRGTGDYGRYKLSCYASKDALAILQKNNWSPKGLHQEHVVPIKAVGDIIMKVGTGLNNQQLLSQLDDLVLPCVITTLENQALNSAKLSRKMPAGWSYPGNRWARYHAVNIPGKGSLFKEIIALRQNLPANGGPAYQGNITLPSNLDPVLPIPRCNCTSWVNQPVNSIVSGAQNL